MSKAISGLSAASEPTGPELFETSQGGTSKKLAVGIPKLFIAAGGAAGDINVTGIKVGDRLDEVVYYVGAGVAVTDVSNLTAEFAIPSNGKINNTGGTASTGGKLAVRWTKRTA